MAAPKDRVGEILERQIASWQKAIKLIEKEHLKTHTTTRAGRVDTTKSTITLLKRKTAELEKILAKHMSKRRPAQS